MFGKGQLTVRIYSATYYACCKLSPVLGHLCSKEIVNPDTISILQYVVPSLVYICETVCRKQTSESIALQLV